MVWGVCVCVLIGASLCVLVCAVVHQCAHRSAHTGVRSNDTSTGLLRVPYSCLFRVPYSSVRTQVYAAMIPALAFFVYFIPVLRRDVRHEREVPATYMCPCMSILIGASLCVPYICQHVFLTHGSTATGKYVTNLRSPHICVSLHVRPYMCSLYVFSCVFVLSLYVHPCACPCMCPYMCPYMFPYMCPYM